MLLMYIIIFVIFHKFASGLKSSGLGSLTVYIPLQRLGLSRWREKPNSLALMIAHDLESRILQPLLSHQREAQKRNIGVDLHLQTADGRGVDLHQVEEVELNLSSLFLWSSSGYGLTVLRDASQSWGHLGGNHLNSSSPRPEPPAGSEVPSMLRISEFFFSSYSRLLADFLSNFGKRIKWSNLSLEYQHFYKKNTQNITLISRCVSH